MDQYLKDIAAHAEKDAPKECCGVVIFGYKRLEAVPLPNVSPTPEKSFLMEPRAYAPYYSNNKIAAFYHSHPADDEKFSQADILVSERAGLPSIVYSLVTKKFSHHTPGAIVPSYIGRNFVFGASDCVSLVEDYYRKELGVVLAPITRTLTDMCEGFKQFEAGVIEQGLIKVTSPQKGDIICMSVGASDGHCNHLGIYLGDGIMLHQLMNRESCEAVYGGYWEKHTVCILRHPKVFI